MLSLKHLCTKFYCLLHIVLRGISSMKAYIYIITYKKIKKIIKIIYLSNNIYIYMYTFTSSNMFDVLPSALFERITTMRRIVKSTVKIQPLNNGSINSTQSITFQLPQDAILDLSTL